MDNELLLNRIQCLKCNDIIISYHVHDFVQCSCKAIANDGGTEYFRRIGLEGIDYKDLSLYDDSPFEEIRDNIKWGTFGKNEDKPLRYLILKEISDNHIKNILRDSKQGSNTMRKLFVREWSYRKKNKIIVEDDKY